MKTFNVVLIGFDLFIAGYGLGTDNVPLTLTGLICGVALLIQERLNKKLNNEVESLKKDLEDGANKGK